MKNSDHLMRQDAAPMQLRPTWPDALVCLVIFALMGLGYGLFQAPLPQGVTKASPPLTGKQFEVCGLGFFDANTREDAVQLTHAAALSKARETNIQTLLTSPDVGTRAAGIVLQTAQILLTVHTEIGALESACKMTQGGTEALSQTQACVAQQQTSAESRNEAEASAAPWVERLALLAAESRDPVVVAQAVRACFGRATTSACDKVSADQWASLEPNNVIPWALVLRQAQVRNDFGAVSEALRRMSLAQYASGYALFAWSKLASEVVNPGSDLQRLVSLEQALTLFVLPSDELSAARAACTKSAVADTSRKQLCEKVAHVLVAHSDTFLTAAHGLAIGRALGWPDSRIATIRAERRAVQQRYQDWNESVSPMDQWLGMRCLEVSKKRKYLVAVGSLGEQAAVLALDADGSKITQHLARTFMPEELARAAQENANAVP